MWKLFEFSTISKFNKETETIFGNMVGTHAFKLIIILLILALKGIKLKVILVIEIPNGQGRGSMYKRHCYRNSYFRPYALLYKVPSKSTVKNFVTNVYCFYLKKL